MASVVVCFHPLHGYQLKDGVTFAKAGGRADQRLTLPCGQCIGCRLEKSRQWATRIMHEAQMHQANSFVTLTYDNANLPVDYSIHLRHWQLFAKRLRKRQLSEIPRNLRKSVKTFRYYMCGEYGDITGRPHYHACLFGVDFSHDRLFLKMSGEHRLYTSKCLSTAWQKGSCIIGDLTFESAAYVARYVLKKRTGPSATSHYQWTNQDTGEVFNRRPEFSTMSRNKGLGRSWYDAHQADLRISDSCVIRGREVRPPAYYDSIFKESEPEAFAAMKAKRISSAEEHSQDQTPGRLAVREAVQARKSSPYSRDFE